MCLYPHWPGATSVTNDLNTVVSHMLAVNHSAKNMSGRGVGGVQECQTTPPLSSQPTHTQLKYPPLADNLSHTGVIHRVEFSSVSAPFCLTSSLYAI